MNRQALAGAIEVAGTIQSSRVRCLCILLFATHFVHMLGSLVFLLIPDTRDLHEGVGEMGGENTVQITISDQALSVIQICLMVCVLLSDILILVLMTHLVHVSGLEEYGQILHSEDEELEFPNWHMRHFLTKPLGAHQTVILNTKRAHHLNLLGLAILLAQILCLAYPNQFMTIYIECEQY